MSEYNIEKANFEKQKEELKTFAEQPATSNDLDKFSTKGKFSDFLGGGLLGMLDHKVTGDEMNEFVAELQKCFVEINERDKKVIKEFGQVYETFESLDKGYIQGILIGMKSAEEASREAKVAQKDIDDTIKALRLTVQKLQEFKKQINAYAHIKDVDEMWDSLNEAVSNIILLKTDIDATIIRLDEITEGFNIYKGKLDGIKHIEDIDQIWDTVKNLKNQIFDQEKKLKEQIGIIQGNVSDLLDFTKSQSHFYDIDKMWNSVCAIDTRINTCNDKNNEIILKQQEQNDSISILQASIKEFESQEHYKEIDKEWEYSHSLGERLEKEANRIEYGNGKLNEFENQIHTVENENVLLRRKISVAYIIAGGSIGLSVVQLILSMLGVL